MFYDVFWNVCESHFRDRKIRRLTKELKWACIIIKCDEKNENVHHKKELKRVLSSFELQLRHKSETLSTNYSLCGDDDLTDFSRWRKLSSKSTHFSWEFRNLRLGKCHLWPLISTSQFPCHGWDVVVPQGKKGSGQMNKSISLFSNLFFNKKCKWCCQQLSFSWVFCLFLYSPSIRSLRMLKDICECFGWKLKKGEKERKE